MSNKMLKKYRINVKKLMRNMLAWYVRTYTMYTYTHIHIHTYTIGTYIYMCVICVHMTVIRTYIYVCVYVHT